ncbi:MAG: thioredoxin fold domain-containing protein [Ignavibacteriales bacterium]|nr:thioredoxin fold domain-containing protein [Ignavibacteriales bacterium]
MKSLPVILIIAAMTFVIAGVFTSPHRSEAAADTDLAWKTFDEGSLLALQQKKKLLVDVYTNWCSWCTKMDKEVYPHEKVKNALTSHFVVVKLDAESDKKLNYQGSMMSEREFARVVGVTGYPTTLFFDENMKPITLLPGYVKAESFANILSFIGEGHYKQTTYKEYLDKLAAPR